MSKNKTELWKQHKENIENGYGIYNHTSALDFVTPEGIYTRNSHKLFPGYRIDFDKIEDSIQAIYRVTIL